MSRYLVWGFSTALAAGLVGQAVAGDPNMAPGQTTLVQSVQNLFSGKSSKPSGSSTAAAPLTYTAPLSPEVMSKCLRNEQDALLRRLQICEGLRDIAEGKGDTALSHQADELEQKAKTLYEARVAALGLPKSKPQPPAIASTMKLEEPLSPQAAADRLIAPSAPVPATSTAEAKEIK